jgi:hypothetical protein
MIIRDIADKLHDRRIAAASPGAYNRPRRYRCAGPRALDASLGLPSSIALPGSAGLSWW